MKTKYIKIFKQNKINFQLKDFEMETTGTQIEQNKKNGNSMKEQSKTDKNRKQ